MWRAIAAGLLLCVSFAANANDLGNSSWSETDAGNNHASPNGWLSGVMTPNQVEPTARAMMGAIKRWYDHIQPTTTSGGAENVQTLTYTQAPAAYVTGDIYTFIAGYTNTGATTLNINGLGAKAVQANGTALAGGEFSAGSIVAVRYDGTQFQISGGDTLANAVPLAAQRNLQIFGIPGTAGNGTTDDAAVIQAYLNSLPSTGTIIYLGRGSKYRIASNLTIPPNVTLDCQQQPNSAGPSYNLNELGGIRLDSTATIIPSIGSRVKHCPILRYGATWPVQTAAAYAGTAITYPADSAFDIWVEDVLMVGFNHCIDGSPARDAAHLHWINVECDATNGYIYPNSADTSIVWNVRDWPWGTWQAVSPTNTRSGTAFSFPATVLTADDSHVGNILDYGHATGLNIDMGTGGTCCSMVFEGNVWLDSETTPFQITGSNVLPQRELHIHSMIVVGGGQGSTPLNLSGAGIVHINNLQEWISTTGTCITLASTTLVVDYLNMSGCAAGAIAVTDTSSKVNVKAGQIINTGTPYVTLPANPAGMAADAVQVHVNAGGNGVLISNAILLPQYAYGDSVTATAGLAAPQSIITGLGQATSALTESGNMGGSFMLNDNGAGVGHGGALVFGSSGGMHRFGALKGYILDGSSNSVGDIDISMRGAAADAALTPLFHFDHTGLFQFIKSPVASSVTACGAGTEGSIQPFTDSTTNTWGQAIVGGGSFHVLGYCDGSNWTVMAQ